MIKLRGEKRVPCFLLVLILSSNPPSIPPTRCLKSQFVLLHLHTSRRSGGKVQTCVQQPRRPAAAVLFVLRRLSPQKSNEMQRHCLCCSVNNAQKWEKSASFVSFPLELSYRSVICDVTKGCDHTLIKAFALICENFAFPLSPSTCGSYNKPSVMLFFVNNCSFFFLIINDVMAAPPSYMMRNNYY